MSTDVRIELDQAERHVLADLLKRFIHERVWEAVRCAADSSQLEESAGRVGRLAQLKLIAEEGNGTLAEEDLDAHRTDLVAWAYETQSTIDEHETVMIECYAEPGTGPQERLEGIESVRKRIVEDYAHRTVCERMVGQIDAAREAVVA